MWDDIKSLDTGANILELFNTDPNRAGAFSVTALEMLFDYSKTGITQASRDALLALAQTAGVAAKRDAMFAGEKINETERRAVLHTALRNLDGDSVIVDGADVMPEVLATLDRMERFASDVRSGAFKGQGGA
ncbi:MAG: glucose-6-phosphate isomerase, partial [Planktotalea sp.]